MNSNKTIAKNTLFLYFRMILVMGVTLYTSRIVLKELGISDYGIYSVIGGFIALFSIFDASMSAATQRYLAYDIGKGDHVRLKKTFSTSLTIIIFVAIAVLILAETVGLWYVNNRLIYPVNRSFAVKFVYQVSICTAIVGIIQVPYNAIIIAKERMSVYAYISIFEVLLKLAIIFALVYFPGDKLINYSILLFSVTLLIRIYYQFYCRKNFKESRYRFIYDKTYFKELISYSGWNLFGNAASVARGQGVNLVLNMFFGTLVNAAFGITSQVQTAVTTFISNFQMAASPQIVKLYAQNDRDGMQRLICRISKFSFYLSLLLVAPIYLNIDFILHLWLVQPPQYSGNLIRISLLCALVDSISGPLMTGIQATGKIKVYQIVVGTLVFLNLPLSYLVFKFNFFNDPEVVFYIWLLISVVSLLFRLIFIYKTQKFNILVFLRQIMLRILALSLIGILIGFVLKQHLAVKSFPDLCLQITIYFSLLLITIFLFGLEVEERKLLRTIGGNFHRRLFKKNASGEASP